MQNRTTFYSLLFTLLILGFSCAKAPVKKVRKTKKSYDQGVEDEFSKIENDQRDVLEYYRRLRSQNWDNYKRKYNRNDKKKYVSPKKSTSPRARTYRPQNYKTPPKISTPEPKQQALPQRRSLPQGQIDEMKIEVRQHMDYFCMQMRKSKRFSDTADCLAFTEDIYNTCMAKYPVLYDRSPVKCIRGKLH